MACGTMALASCAQSSTIQAGQTGQSGDSAVVYMTKEISPEALVKIYKALGREAKGKVAVKISTGEPGGHNFLQPSLIADLVKLTDGTIVECNTAYAGRRNTTEAHRKAVEEHGFTAIAPVDIMDAEGEIKLPVKDGKHLKYDIVGSHFPDYNFTLFCLTSKAMQWVVSEVRLKTCRSA